jgi:hypothetical protein
VSCGSLDALAQAEGLRELVESFAVSGCVCGCEVKWVQGWPWPHS